MPLQRKTILFVFLILFSPFPEWSPTVTTPEITTSQLDILDHTINRAARGMFAGDSPDMQALVSADLMVSRGKTAWCPDEYFSVTAAGIAVWQKSLRGLANTKVGT